MARTDRPDRHRFLLYGKAVTLLTPYPEHISPLAISLASSGCIAVRAASRIDVPLVQAWPQSDWWLVTPARRSPQRSGRTLAANCRAFALVAAGWFPRGLFERGRRSSSSSSRLSRSNTQFSRARRSSITFRLSPTWGRCWRARSTPLRLMQITGRIIIPVAIIAAFSTSPMADVGHNSLRAGYAVSNSDTPDMFATPQKA